MVARFVENRSGIAQLGRTAQMGEALQAAAQEGVDIAEQISPRMSGDYAASHEATMAFVDDHVVGRMKNTDFKANWIEFGTIYKAPYAILRRAAEAAGLKWGRRILR